MLFIFITLSLFTVLLLFELKIFIINKSFFSSHLLKDIYIPLKLF